MIWLRYLGSKNVYLFICLFVYLLICLFFYFNHLGTPTVTYPKNFVKIQLDLAEILRISKLDWHDREEGEEKGRRGGILLCNGLI